MFWTSLHANSIVVTPSGTVYLGMRRGVARVVKKDGSYHVAWLLPNKEFADMEPR